MYTITHPRLAAKAGEPVSIAFDVTDNDGVPVSLISAASAVYRLGRSANDAALLEKTSTAGAITFAGNVATVTFNTNELVSSSSAQLYGDFLGQLLITKSGDTLVVSEGYLCVGPVMPPSVA